MVEINKFNSFGKICRTLQPGETVQEKRQDEWSCVSTPGLTLLTTLVLIAAYVKRVKIRVIIFQFQIINVLEEGLVHFNTVTTVLQKLDI